MIRIYIIISLISFLLYLWLVNYIPDGKGYKLLLIFGNSTVVLMVTIISAFIVSILIYHDVIKSGNFTGDILTTFIFGIVMLPYMLVGSFSGFIFSIIKNIKNTN